MLENAAPHASRRAFLFGASALVLSGCSLRFEDGSHVPGPTASAPSDIGPLQEIRAYLLRTMTACSGEKTYAKPAVATFALHQQQLARFDATLTGLKAPRPAATSIAPPASPKPTAPASTSTKTKPSPSSSAPTPTATSAPKPTSWTQAEWGWLNLAPTFARVSAHSRPLVIACAASSIASTMASGLNPTWSSSATLPPQSSPEILTALAPAIAASEWLVAHAHGTDRAPLADDVTWMYAARAMASSPSGTTVAPTSSPSPSQEPVWSFTSNADAQNMVRKALGNLLSACVAAAQHTTNEHDCLGALFMWSHATRQLAQLGTSVTPFPGLTS